MNRESPMADASTSRAQRGVPITIRRVSKTFGQDTDRPFLALKEVSVEIAAGEFVAVMEADGYNVLPDRVFLRRVEELCGRGSIKVID